jgi:hypothetical protein
MKTAREANSEAALTATKNRFRTFPLIGSADQRSSHTNIPFNTAKMINEITNFTTIRHTPFLGRR